MGPQVQPQHKNLEYALRDIVAFGVSPGSLGSSWTRQVRLLYALPIGMGEAGLKWLSRACIRSKSLPNTPFDNS